MRQLSLAARPKSLDGLVGQQKTVDAIRAHILTGRYPKAWLFTGPKGTGKTTTARILALAYQCQHQKLFGSPCLECRKKRANFPITEIPAADVTGIDLLRTKLEGAAYGVLGEGKYRIYVLDEAHRFSGSAQDLLLKYLEDSPDTTVFILCSSAPHKIVDTLRSRCVTYELKELQQDDILLLVRRLLKVAGCKLPADRLVESLIEKSVWSPRLIAQAVEKYAAVGNADEAAMVDGGTSIDTGALIRAVGKGEWGDVALFLKRVQGTDVKSVRLSVIAYLRAVLLESAEVGTRTEAMARAVSNLCEAHAFEDSVQAASLAAVLYRVTAIFAKYKL